MAEIKPAEISAILRKQVEGLNLALHEDRSFSTSVGMVLLVFDGLIR
jgi:hypothetical protein